MSVAQPIEDGRADGETYALIRSAIEKRLQVAATYKGLYRELCPHAI